MSCYIHNVQGPFGTSMASKPRISLERTKDLGLEASEISRQFTCFMTPWKQSTGPEFLSMSAKHWPLNDPGNKLKAATKEKNSFLKTALEMTVFIFI